MTDSPFTAVQAGDGIDGDGDSGGIPYLTSQNVLLSSILILSAATLSTALNLHLTTRILIAATRCVLQLHMLSHILGPVLRTDTTPWPVLGMTTAFLVLGLLEAVGNNAKYTFWGMPGVVGVAMGSAMVMHLAFVLFVSTDPTPFWSPRVVIPIAGMLMGNMIAGISLSLKTLLTTLVDHPARIETLLAFGATRREIYRPLLADALRTGLLPTLNSMSVMGSISIPGQMTGQILAGAEVGQAAYYQMIVMMAIFSASLTGQILSLMGCLYIVIDGHLMIKPERIQLENYGQRFGRWCREQYIHPFQSSAVRWWRGGYTAVSNPRHRG